MEAEDDNVHGDRGDARARVRHTIKHVRSDTREIHARMARVVQRAQRLGRDEPVDTMAPDDPDSHEIVAALAVAAADLLDELLERIGAERRMLRRVGDDEMHAVASAAAGDLRGVLRTMRALDPARVGHHAAGLRAHDQLVRIALAVEAGLATTP